MTTRDDVTTALANLAEQTDRLAEQASVYSSRLVEIDSMCRDNWDDQSLLRRLIRRTASGGDDNPQPPTARPGYQRLAAEVERLATDNDRLREENAVLHRQQARLLGLADTHGPAGTTGEEA